MNFLITMDGSHELAQLATNFKQRKEEEVELLKDSPHEAIYLNQLRLNNRGHMLRELQEYVLLNVNAYHRVMDDDDLIEAIKDGTIDADLDAVIKFISRVEAQEPWAVVLSVIPIDFNGTVGIVVTNKSKFHHMNS